jgi:hypothetical protein
VNSILQELPTLATELRTPAEVARLLSQRFLERKPAALLRFGDTSGRVLAQPDLDTPEFEYLRNFLGRTVTPAQVEWLGQKIKACVACADVIGLRSDLLGPKLPDDFSKTPSDRIRQRLCSLYPIRPFAQKNMDPDGAKRLSETRNAMELLALRREALLTSAWIHLDLTEIGFISALVRHAPAFSVVTSAVRRDVLIALSKSAGARVRVFECPAYPTEERNWGGDHSFLWDRWMNLVSSLKPSYVGEPLLVSAGIWTKVILPQWVEQGGIAIDMGSVMDYFSNNATRPAVLATYYGNPEEVPSHLHFDAQIIRSETIQSFL